MNNTPTPVHTRAQPRPKREKLPYPNLLGKGHNLFWVAVFLREHAKVAALQALYTRAFDKKTGRCKPEEAHALLGAIAHQEKEEAYALAIVKEYGHLLFAWPGTTVLTLSTQGAA